MDAPDPRERLGLAGDAIVARVEQVLPEWIEGCVHRIADAWGRLDDDARAALDLHAREAARAATARVVDALRGLFAMDPREQRTTPLAIVRTAATEITEVLASAGIPPVERDSFEERAFPDDHYGATPASFVELGDDDLGPLQLEWGLAKARVLQQN